MALAITGTRTWYLLCARFLSLVWVALRILESVYRGFERIRTQYEYDPTLAKVKGGGAAGDRAA
eukprot:scaffold428013_cov31-Prasinocladus_malaysianus.AAC.1